MMMFQTLQRVMTGADQTLRLECGACGHAAALVRDDAFALFGPAAGPYEIRRASRCRQCGEREKIRISI
jgi:predicted RNA-binding Zn-ribbon protein involved in translation (DUF1610 family)